MTTVTPTLEFHNGTDWQDITGDFIAGSLRWRGGILGSGPTDRVAVPGSLEVELKNGTNNSGGLLGYYSPDHSNRRAGWALGAKIRVKLVSGANTRYWMYRIKSIEPSMGQYRERRVSVTAKDYMEEFSSRKVSGLAIQSGSRGDELLTALVATMPFAPENTSYDAGAFYFPYAFHDEKDEETACLTIVQKINQSDLSYTYCDGDATDGETLHYESHLTRFSNFTAAGTISDTMTGLSLIHSKDNIFNKIKAVTSPVMVDTEISVLGRIPEEFPLEPGETKTNYIRYIDETTARRISGVNLVTPVEDTDYKMSSKSDDNGNNMNAQLSILPTAGANTMQVVTENTDGTIKGYVNRLQVRGYKVTMYDKVESVESGTASITAYGEHTLTYNMPYQNNSVFGKAVAIEILRRYENPNSNISGVMFIANRDSTLMSYALTHGIGTRELIAETVTGVNLGFFVNGFDYELMEGDVLQVSWTLERAFNDTAYFTIDHTTYGVIDGVYLIAPF